MEIDFSAVTDTWKQHDLSEASIRINGINTGKKAIIRGREPVAIVSNKYFLYPNEEAIKAADESADLANLIHFTQFRHRWYKSSNSELGGHVIMNNRNTRMHALYATDKTHLVNGEKVRLGVEIHNSIDGSRSFGCGVFTFREICSNGVILGYTELGTRVVMKHYQKLGNFAKEMKTNIIAVLDRGLQILEEYKRLAQEAITQELIEEIRKMEVPKKLLPDYVKTPAEQLNLNLDSITKWDLYNDLTEAIWHSKTAITSKQHYCTIIHRTVR